MNGTGNGQPESNQGQIKIIIRTIAVISVTCIWGLFVLIYFDKTIPTELWLLASNAVTALTAMLVKTSATFSTPTEQKPSGNVTVPEQTLETKT